MDTPGTSLNQEEVPVGAPLEWAIVDETGALLLDRGVALAGERDLAFLFAHFRPHRLTQEAAQAQSAPRGGDNEPDASQPPTLKDMHLTIGGLLGIRSRAGGSAMQPSRLIGFSPNQALFVTPPLAGGRPAPLMAGENVDVVAIASQAVFRFSCTVEALCSHPFDYVVLSSPGAIRRLRERKSIRVRTRLPVRYATNEAGDVYGGLALASGISASGMSLIAPRALGEVGERIKLAFQLRSDDLDAHIETTAVIRNVQNTPNADRMTTTHGLEFDPLEPAQQMALKSFVFDRQEDTEYWVGGSR
ncbi:flagellar brake protein [Trinickia violacea]|uniref:Flagellar brake protein n=1 Tax=Trinickia violacea TaxID=2571746 RepID=A0A4P8IYN1_9BURK|nr:flagellar brake protein [Trinickia violacea]QCP52354.1 flagellar brake protein [Trinickia violacea]